MNEKKINPSFLILHSIIVWGLYILTDQIAPIWFTNVMNPEEALTIQEMLAGAIIVFPLLFLVALWMKSLFNNIIPIIFNTREINYWEAFGLLLISIFFGM